MATKDPHRWLELALSKTNLQKIRITNKEHSVLWNKATEEARMSRITRRDLRV